MKAAIAFASFAYGCIALVVTAVLVVAAWTIDLTTYEVSGKTVLVLFGAHGAVLCITFQRFPTVGPFWAPLFTPTPRRLTVARLLIGGSFLVLGAAFLYAALVVGSGDEASAIKGLSLFILSMVALSSTYIAVHWAFRPENIFTPQFLHVMKNPLVYLFGRKFS